MRSRPHALDFARAVVRARFTGRAGVDLVQVEGGEGRWWRVPGWSIGAARNVCCIQTRSEAQFEQALRAHGCSVSVGTPRDAIPDGPLNVLKLDVDTGTDELLRQVFRGWAPSVVCIDFGRDRSRRTRASCAARLWRSGYGVAVVDRDRATFVRLSDAAAEVDRLPAVVGTVTSAGRSVALTFDDGPSAWTNGVLEALARHGVRATFFILGNAIEGREETLRRAHEAGHEIGSHAFSHVPLDTLSADAIRDELQRTSSAVEAVTGVRPRVFRPPGLRYNVTVLEVARDCGFDRVITGSVVVRDWEVESAEEICKGVVDGTRRGSILVLHDGRPANEPSHSDGGSREDRWATVNALGGIIQDLRGRGYTLVTVSELLAIG